MTDSDRLHLIWQDKLFAGLESKGNEIYEQARALKPNWIPKTTDNSWLPIDDELLKLSKRKHSPKLVVSLEEFAGVDKQHPGAGLFQLARFHLSSAYLKASTNGTIWQDDDLGKAGNFIGDVIKLKEAILKFTNRVSEDSLGFPTFSARLDPAEKHIRLQIARAAEDQLGAALKNLLTMESWAGDIFTDPRPSDGGRPPIEWRRDFVAVLARFWLLITGKKAPSHPDSLFAKYVDAAWDSGGLDPMELDWGHTIRTVVLKKNAETD